MRLAFDIGRGGLVLGIQRVKILIKTLIRREPSYRSRSGPCQLVLLLSFGLPGIDLGPPVPKAKETGTVPFGPGDGKGNLGQAIERLTVPCKTVRHDHDPMGLSVPFPHQNSPRGVAQTVSGPAGPGSLKQPRSDLPASQLA